MTKLTLRVYWRVETFGTVTIDAHDEDMARHEAEGIIKRLQKSLPIETKIEWSTPATTEYKVLPGVTRQLVVIEDDDEDEEEEDRRSRVRSRVRERLSR